MATQLSFGNLRKIFSHLDDDTLNKLALVSKKSTKAVIHAKFDLWFYQLINEIGIDFFNENYTQCYKANGELFSLNYRKFPKELKPLLELLHSYPGHSLKYIKNLITVKKNYNRWKKNTDLPDLDLSLIEDENRKRKLDADVIEAKRKIMPPEITESHIFKLIVTALDSEINDKTLTKETLDQYLDLLESELKEEYLENEVDEVVKALKEACLDSIDPVLTRDVKENTDVNDSDNFENADEYFNNEPYDPDPVEDGQPKDVESTENNFENADDYFGDFDDFKDIDPNQIYEVGFDKEHGIIRANLMQDRYNRLIQVRDLIGELLKTSYTDFVYRYYFAGVGWKTLKLHGHESLKKLIDVIEGFGLYNRSEMNQTAISDFYNKDAIPEPEFVDAIWIGPEVNNKVKDGQPEKATNGGEFYPYRFLLEVNDFKGYYEIAQITDELWTFAENANKDVATATGKITYKDMFELNCFCYALDQASNGPYAKTKIPDDVLDEIKMHCLSRYQKSSKLKDICKTVGICIKITYERKDNTANKTGVKYIGAPLNDHKYYVEMGLLREPGMLGDHYFYNPEIPVTSFHLKHRQEMKKWATEHNKDISSMHNKQRFNKNKNCYQVKGKQNSTISLFDLLIWTRDNGYFSKYTMEETLILPTNLYTCIKDNITNLDYYDSSLRNIKTKVSKKKDKRSSTDLKIYYADFEASTQGFHKPYCVSFSSRDEKKINTIYGYDCAYKLLDKLEHNSLTYFHNLAYDGRFLAKYGIKQCIKKGGKLLSFKISFKGKNLQFRDSWAMISSKLSDFPSMFGIKGVEKELYPYNYYSEERVNKNVGLISEAGKYEIVPWTEEQYKIFNENIDKIKDCRVDKYECPDENGKYFDMKLYCQFYCEQDVNILKIGHTTFRDLVLEELNLDIDKSISISSLANKYFELNVYSKIDELYEYSGVIREYIQGCVKGGRCMTRQNKKWHCTETLYDYDACSLYPSAVHRLKLATGKPIVVPDEWCGDSKYLLEHSMEEQQLTPSKEKFISAFIVDIEITKVGKELAFPIIMKKTKQGNLNCNECCEIRVDNYELEDLIKFQQIEFIIKRGYYWTGARSDLFSKEMKRIYDLRVQYKKQKNPLQLVLKLLMNSTYGKTIQKPIKSALVYKQVSRKDKEGVIYNDAARYNKKNAALIKEYYHVSDNIMCFDVDKSFDDFFVPNLIGVQILSMSKRIMNEVMCLAEDLGIMIYYQDTDSMHIPVDKVPLLEEEYYKKYNRVLRGSDMGQFHPDFESDKIKGDLKSVESYFLGKKAYCDKLMNDDGEVDYHLRLKGIPNNLLESEHEDPLELYKFMYEGGEYKFNLLKLRPSFEMTKDMKIRSRTEFCRKIRF